MSGIANCKVSDQFLLLSESGPEVRAVTAGRIKYEQTIGDIKQAVEKKLGIPVDKQQLFWHNKELTKVIAKPALATAKMLHC